MWRRTAGVPPSSRRCAVPVFLNADTKRAAIQELVDAVDHRALLWSVIANREGELNKVTFRPDGAGVPGFYCYTSAAQPVAGPLGAGVSAAH